MEPTHIFAGLRLKNTLSSNNESIWFFILPYKYFIQIFQILHKQQTPYPLAHVPDAVPPEMRKKWK